MAVTDVDTTVHGIKIRGVSKTYETTDRSIVHALYDIQLDIAQGEFVSFLGPSGCGKSTLLHAVAGLLEPTVGNVDVFGVPAAPGRNDSATMLQAPVLLPWRSVRDNVLLPVELLKLNIDESRDRAKELLELMHISEFADKYVWELSGGMRQRVSLARALVTDPALLLMDEPFSSLDEFTRERLNLELSRLHERRGRTTLYVTHNISEAVFLSDRVVCMRPRPGEVIEVVDVPLARPRTQDHRTIEAAFNAERSVRKIIGDYV